MLSNNSKRPAYPVWTTDKKVTKTWGFNKHEAYFGMFMQGLLANPENSGETDQDLINRADGLAQLALTQLGEPRENE